MKTFYQILDTLRNVYLTVVFAMTFQLLSRSLDYLTGNPRPGNSLVDVVGLEPQMLWGVAGLIAVSVVVAGLLMKRPLVITAGASVAVIIYLTFAWMQVVSVVGDGAPYDDWRTATAHLTGVVLWGMVGIVGALIPSFEKVKKEYDGVFAGPDL